MAKTKQAVVTGGAGFIGSHVVERLLKDGHAVRVLDDLSTGRLENLAAARKNPGLSFERVDLSRAGDLSFKDADWVFHLAALADIVPSITHPTQYHRANVESTVAVLEAARAAGVKRLVYAASSSCYGIPDKFPTPESAPARPMYPYALTKHVAEQYVLHWGQVYGLPCVSLRLFNVYGPRARTGGTYGAVFGVFLAQKLAGKKLTVVGDGSQTRDFTFVTDVAEAFVKAAESNASGESFNVGSGGTYSVNRLVELLGGEKVHIPKRPGEPDCTFADTSRIRKELGWAPQVSFEKGVKIMLEHIEDWRKAPVWDEKSIEKATKEWFTHLGGSMPANGKIKTLAELATVLEGLRARKKRIVHCHGVFDLLHIGHIRHFEEAKRLGDVLVVTLTRDSHVNKGPHRPIFPQDLRAEAVAALDCVDYVAINEWPMAVRTIKLLRPHVYAKGPDYIEAKKDLTGGIDLERRAVKSVAGEFAVTRGITFSSSNLLNKYLPVLPKDTVDYLAGFSRRHGVDGLLRYLKGSSSMKILLIGETILDEYRYCRAIGKSSKEPMLAVQHLSTEMFAGGILAVANHASQFCAETRVVSCLGETDSHERFLRSRLKPGVTPRFIYKKDSPTIVKRRFIDQYFFTKLLAVYEMNDAPLTGADNRRFCDILRAELKRCDLAVVVDFGHGVMTPEAIDILCRKAPFLAVNTQSNAGNQGYHTISRYPRADYICMADNEFRLEARDRHKDIHEIVQDLSRRMRCPSIVVTGGKAGCLAYNRREGFFEIPAVAGKVVDRMGAGDAFLAVTAPCVAQGAPIEVTGFIGNAVGAQAVATVGHRSSIERVPLFKHIETLLK